jgi:hypothetical protein
MNKWKWIVGTVVTIAVFTVTLIVGLKLGYRKMSKNESELRDVTHTNLSVLLVPLWMTKRMNKGH